MCTFRNKRSILDSLIFKSQKLRKWATDRYQQDLALDLYDSPLPIPIQRRWMESDPPSKEALLFLYLAWRVKRRYSSTAFWRFTL
jgi:hypothetical protein